MLLTRPLLNTLSLPDDNILLLIIVNSITDEIDGTDYCVYLLKLCFVECELMDMSKE